MTPEQALWCEVLYIAVNDAIAGASADAGSRDTATRIKQIESARRYITQPSADLNEVCHMAGLDPVAVREHASRQIAKAPTPAELATQSKRVTPILTYQGQTLPIREWADIVGLTAPTLSNRIRKGWSIEKALSLPNGYRIKATPKPKPMASHRPAKGLTYEGQTHSVAEWSEITGIKVHTLHMRLRSGWSVEATLTTKPTPRGTRPKDQSTFTPPVQTPGVRHDFAPSLGTGGGPFAPEIPLNNFSKDCAA